MTTAGQPNASDFPQQLNGYRYRVERSGRVVAQNQAGAEVVYPDWKSFWQAAGSPEPTGMNRVSTTLKLMFFAAVATGAVYKLFSEEGITAIPVILWSVFLFLIFPAAVFRFGAPYITKYRLWLSKGIPAGNAIIILVGIGIIAWVVFTIYSRVTEG